MNRFSRTVAARMLLASALSLPLVSMASTASAEALTMDDFKAATTNGIVKLCTAPAGDAMHDSAIGYCVGYLTGAFHYYKLLEGAPGEPKLVCFGTAEPSRREEIDGYIAWAQAHPQYGSAPAVDTMFRFLGEKYPCH